MAQHVIMLIFGLCLFLERSQPLKASHELDELDLKKTLMSRYIRSVRPVNSFRDTVQVSFDLGMRALVDLDEKNQVLTTSVWIRVYWKDAFLVWDPSNYSDIKSVNFSPSDVWIPDLVLYNSADEGGRGLLDFSMKTHVKVQYDGSVAWLCPMVLKSECTVSIGHFPFDSQSCPLHFGLWTYDGFKVNLSIVRNSGDLANYLPNGEFVLESMPGYRDEAFYTVAPNIPFPYVMYKINIIRRTKFYLMNIIMPGILIALLASLCYVLPPECGERIGLGITNLLAMMVFLLMISESIPPTSEAIPLASKFFTAVLVLSALTLLSSAIVITYTFYSNPSTTGIPWVVKVVINKWLAKIAFVQPSASEKKQESLRYPKNITVEPSREEENIELIPMSGFDPYTSDTPMMPRGDRKKKYTEREPLIVGDCGQKISEGLVQIVSKLRNEDEEQEYKAQWRKAAKVMDRVFLFCFTFCIIGALISIYVEAPHFYVG